MGEQKSLYDRLRDNNLTFVWLIGVLNGLGVHTDKTEMSSAVKGTRSGEKVNTILSTSHAVLDRYEEFIHSVQV